MNVNELLEVLCKFGVEHHYPCLFNNGITSPGQLEELDASKLRALGISGRDDVANLCELITKLRVERQREEEWFYEQQQKEHQKRLGRIPAPPTDVARGRREVVGYGDSDEDMQFVGSSSYDGGSAAPRVGGQTQGRRPSSMYKQQSGPSSVIPRAAGGGSTSSFSPPMQAAFAGSSESRTIGRQGMLPPPGKVAAAVAAAGGGRRQSLAPPSTSGLNRSRTMAARPGGNNSAGRPLVAGRRGRVSNVSEILERSNEVALAQRSMEDSDEDLERVVRKTGQSGLVNAYGIPMRPTTAHAKRSASDRRSLAPSSQPDRVRPAVAPTIQDKMCNTPPSNLHDKIRVCVRKRPLNSKEKERGEKDIVMPTGGRSLSVMEPKTKVDLTKYIEESRFVFDEVFSEHVSNTQVYERTAKPLVEYIFGGGNATCFAYGQTGSGKTYTMLDTHNGLYIQAAEDLFAMVQRPEHQHLQVHVSFYEIYLTNLFDLLANRARLNAREDANQNVCIQGLREVLVGSADDLLSVFEFGNGCRSTGSTGANADSSRSHAILQISLRDPRSARSPVRGKLSFIDLAGNERGADRGDRANKQTMMEGAEINKSLLALKECIRALDLNKKHQPFRQSKLTQVLKDSFLGNSRACMVATISPNTGNSDNTLNTLRYADRVKAMKNGGGASGECDSGEGIVDQSEEAEYQAGYVGGSEETEYYASNVDPTYEDDSGDRASEDIGHGINHGWHGGFQPGAHSILHEEDEYADDLDAGFDAVAAPSTAKTYDHHHQPQKLRRLSLEERIERELATADVASIMDEQPMFLDDAPYAARSPRSYGSPAAKSFVASRLARSPTATRQKQGSKLTGLLDLAPPMARSSSMELASHHAPHAQGRGTRARSNTQSGVPVDHHQRGYDDALSPHTSALSVPSDSNSPKEDDASSGSHRAATDNGEGDFSRAPPTGHAAATRARDIDALMAPFGGLRVAEVDSLVKLHRAEIRATTKACKEETGLVTTYTSFSYATLAQNQMRPASQPAAAPDGRLSSNSWEQSQLQSVADKYRLDVSTGAVVRLSDSAMFESVDHAKVYEAREYLERLDEVLARKQQVIVDLRTEIRKLVWNARPPQ